MELHSKGCLAAAIIAAVENWRDSEGMTDHAFRIAMQQNEALTEADTYLATQTMTCTCGAWYMDSVRRAYDEHGAQSGTELAADYLRQGYLSTNQYVRLVRWSEGRDVLPDEPDHQPGPVSRG